jgi:hypothetical protein
MTVCAVVLADGTIRDVIMADPSDPVPDGAVRLAQVPDGNLIPGSVFMTRAWKFDATRSLFVAPVSVGAKVEF